MRKYRIPEEDMILVELGVGLVFYGIIVQIILFFIPENLMELTMGLWAGIILAAGMSFHMKRTIEDALDIGTTGAEKHLKKNSALRMLVVMLLICMFIYFDIGNMYSLFVGVFGLKISAYLQPYIYKLRKNSK